jgi:RHS repeat-associated protein
VVGTFSPTSTAEGLAGFSSYSPYGAEISADFGENLGYQGDCTDPVTGLVYMNARWYNPATGSFVSSDTLNGTPIPSTVDGNPYAYADGNPVTDIDPTGHSIWSDVGDDIDVATHDALEAGDAAYDGLVSYAEPVGEGLVDGASAAAAGLAVLTTAGLTALFTGLSWIDADSTESGCEDVICGQQGYGGGSPAPTWGPEGTPPGGSPGHAGHTVSTGPYACATGCGPISAPQPPPPPPPPPQDCYAGPDPACAVPPAPGSLLHTPLVTSTVKNITSFVELCRQGDCITEHDTSKQGAIKGTTPSNNENPGNPDDADQNDQQLLQPIQNQGVQPAPEPEPQPAADGAGKGSGDGACVPSDLTDVFRVEGPGNERLDISPSGDVAINGSNMLFLNFGQEDRAQDFLERRQAQGHEGDVIKTFQVPTSFVDELRATAVPESKKKLFPTSPLVVDTNAAVDQFGLRASHFGNLLNNVIPGSGGVC